MIEESSFSQWAETRKQPKDLSTPLLYLSSTEAGWEGLEAQAFHEPKELEGWIVPASSDVSLILFNGGPMRIEQRQGQGSWKSQHIRQDDLILRSGSETDAEIRWKSLSPISTRTLHLLLPKRLLVKTAEEVTGSTTNLSLIGRSGFQDALLAQIGFALWHELEQPAHTGKLYAQTAAQLLAVHLLRHYSTKHKNIKEPAQGLNRRQQQQVTDFILAHLSQELSLEELAQQTSFSPYHFARLFKQTMGESPHQFVLKQRILAAQQLLTGTNMPLALIAIESGFANQSHFTRLFKRQVGLTPHEFRRRI